MLQAASPTVVVCLGLLAPFPALSTAALEALPSLDRAQQYQEDLYDRASQQQDGTIQLALLTLLLSSAVPQGRRTLCDLAAADPPSSLYQGLLRPLATTPPHPSLHSRLGALIGGLWAATSGADSEGAADADAAAGVLLPTLVACLCMDRQYGAAAALAAQRLRVHPALNSLGGGLAVSSS